MNTFNKFAITIALLLLTSCGDQQSKIYDTTSKDRWTQITISVTWVPENKISEVCTRLGTSSKFVYRGCARSKPDDITVCEIYAVRPRDFDDKEALMHFGHETWHCLGAVHDN